MKSRKLLKLKLQENISKLKRLEPKMNKCYIEVGISVKYIQYRETWYSLKEQCKILKWVLRK